MAKLTLEDLRRMRGEKQQAMSQRETSGKEIQVVVGMGTCGIAAGAKDTFGTLVDELAAKNITNVLVRQTGCMGLCHSEPTVEVIAPDMPTVIYGNVDAAAAREIIEKHVLGRQLLDSRICDRPSIDIIKQG